MKINAGDALALAVYAYWANNGHQIAPALRAVADYHPDAAVRDAAEFDFVVETLLAYCVSRAAEESAAVVVA